MHRKGRQKGSGNGWTLGKETIGGLPVRERYSNCPAVDPRSDKFAAALY
jgi:hypothetical protein